MTKADDRYGEAANLLASGYTDEAVADSIGVSERTVRRWRAAGKIPDPRAEEEVEVTLAEARRRKEAALAMLREMEVGVRSGQLRDQEEVIAGQREIAHHVKSTFLAWPGRVSAEIAADLGIEAGAVAVVLERHVRSFLTELSEMFASHADGPAEDEAA